MQTSVTAISLGGIIVLFAAVLFAALHYRRRQRKQRQLLGLTWLNALRLLLSHIQQHRGLTTGYLSGDNELLQKIQQCQHTVNRDISSVAAIDQWLEANERWRAITEHWAKICTKFQSVSAENNLVQHNRLIQNVLYQIDDMAHEHDLLLLKSQGDKPLRLAWRELLSAAECVGQVRALGTGIVAAKDYDCVARIRLHFLCQKISKTTDRVWRDLSPTSEQRDRVKVLLDCVEQELAVERPTIAVQTYFNIASSALDGLHDQFDTIVDSLRSDISINISTNINTNINTT